ncbi:putative hemolysin [Rhodobium orientis]|uniref:Glycerol acyltransferase n=1 Tax=Rhodobium orientis TaxID=34017 RepID=A0A327JYH4_9HYPH|nr:lysophospholipid acyltransferase family protein [Rhodobium orientis]MBB4301687.1 putative hemolysin [Rhodobium orientis]MBK5952381.1 glycerol acyltransferase [Rhodobium orientis]RAI28138.1 glycerol acyltransferase [Rhodobium orientis]
MKFKELSYASPSDPRLKRWVIHTVEGLSGRGRLVALYETWRRDIVGRSSRVMGDLLNLIGVELEISGAPWPPADLPAAPLVIVANHPFGIGDGIAVLSLAEQLGRPFRVLIHNDLLKVPEIRPYSLPIDFSETREAMLLNIATRKEALRLLKEGVTIVIFPAGGVATAPSPFGKAVELPWKTFTARMILDARAAVLPVFFEGQNSRLFHLVSRVSQTLRLSLLVREFRRFIGSRLPVRVGEVIDHAELAHLKDRQALMQRLHDEVHALGRNERRSRRRFDFPRAA